MQNIKSFTLKHVIIAGLAGSLLWNGIAFALTFVYWGVNPIFPPPIVMLLPGILIDGIMISGPREAECKAQLQYETVCDETRMRPIYDRCSSKSRAAPDKLSEYQKCLAEDQAAQACKQAVASVDTCTHGNLPDDAFMYLVNIAIVWVMLAVLFAMLRFLLPTTLTNKEK